ncbi:Sorting nexin-4 [Ceratocystis fimbriata CBS 114723]|uniref:Sorting nexin-4 n=1 Tax=Ceratocystis fimbriata CBS 114723 TaxID=1035309 RepID=A0A2C5XCM7_9PEZI|nr:Sorting nexin-4 [Ceratocystis fimbriata CBS 114723]
MDNDFDNVTWDTEHDAFSNSRPARPSSSASSYNYDDDIIAGSSRATPIPAHIDAGAHIDVGDSPGDRLECTVTSPIKEQDGSKDAFVSYLITTTSDFPSFQKPISSVRRRFTDFVYLYKALVKEFVACAVPPIPDKQRMEYVRGDRFGSEFTNRRAKSLERFLTRISMHPYLRRAKILHTFLESPDWNATMRSRNQRNSMSSENGSTGAGGVFDAFADSVINAFTKVHKPDQRFNEVRDKTDKLDEDLASIEKILVRVVRRLSDLETDQRELAEQFRKLIAMEPGIEYEVRDFAATLDSTASNLRQMRENTDVEYLGSVRDMEAYCGAMKSLLKTREQKQLDYEQLTEYLTKSTSERESMRGGGGSSGGASYTLGITGAIRSRIEDARGVDHEQARRERQRKLELRIEMLSSEAESAKSTTQLFNDEVIREVRDFDRIKRVEFRHQLLGLCDANLEYYDNVVASWEEYIAQQERRQRPEMQ